MRTDLTDGVIPLDIPVAYSRDTQELGCDASGSLMKGLAWLASYASYCAVGYFDSEEACEAYENAEDALANAVVSIVGICESRGLDIQAAFNRMMHP